jgi:hypothetical protein
MKITLGVRQRGHGAAVEQIARNRADARRLEPLSLTRVGEPRHCRHVSLVADLPASAMNHRRQRRPHLPCRAQDHHVARASP